MFLTAHLYGCMPALEPTREAAREEVEVPMKRSKVADTGAPAPASPVKYSSPTSRPKASRSGNTETIAPVRQAPAPRPVVHERVDEGWGRSVWLSNDDSMSLASAQRLLWALREGAPLPADQIRPHELLNYFTFTTNDVAPGETFSVRGAAESTGEDTLTLTLAVRGVVPERAPLDLTLVVDRSGSMGEDDRIAFVKRGLDRMTAQLLPGDRVDLVTFDHRVEVVLDSLVIGRDPVAWLSSAVASLEPDGTTDLAAGLREGYRRARAHPVEAGRERRVLLLTDAKLNAGDLDTSLLSEVAQAHDDAGIRLSVVGVGDDVNDRVLDQLSERGKGAYVYLGSDAVVDRVFGPGFVSLTRTVAHDVRFELDLPDSLGMKRFYGEESSTRVEDVQPIHYFAGTTQLFLQDLRLRDGKLRGDDKITLTIHFRDPATGVARKQAFVWSLAGLLEADTRDLRKARALWAWSELALAGATGAVCRDEVREWRARAERVGDDAEIGWLDKLTRPDCEFEPRVRATRPGTAAVKVVVDADTDIHYAEVACQDGYRQRKEIVSGDRVATFPDVPRSNPCTLFVKTRGGPVGPGAGLALDSPSVSVRCRVRGSTLACT